MAYPINTGAILQAVGYDPMADFEWRNDGAGASLTWTHSDQQPTEQQVTDWASDSVALPSGKTFTESQAPAHVEINGIKWKTDEASQAAFSSMTLLIDKAAMPATDMVMIKDAMGVSQAMTVTQYQADVLTYGLACYSQFHS